jgi:predicted hotdog family 3-hydroxylacyl-ACP dehydratase
MSPEWSVEELLPHSESMVLLDEVVEWGDGWAVAAVRVAEDTAFFEPGVGVPSWVGIEYMAQTVAMYVGICAKRESKPIRIGLLLGTRSYKAGCSHFRLGTRPRIRVQEIWRDAQMASFECHIEDGERLADATLNLFQPDDSPKLTGGR